MNAQTERIKRDIVRGLGDLYNHAYEEGKLDQERDDIVKIQEAYDRGADEGYVEGERDGYRKGIKEVKN